ncbi:hypothetical protein M422DRAFT_27858 [Sphaerobolus stellatus SS14]|nr:hypothetical protein M422DRAFT_27858 [Sphaerobolus stellatus SS14]
MVKYGLNATAGRVTVVLTNLPLRKVGKAILGMLQTRRAYSSCRTLLYIALAALITSTQVLADDFDCNKPVDVGGAEYDFKSLAKEHTVSRTEESPPTTNIWDLRFNVCQAVSKKEGVSDDDQCPSGTRACLTINNKKKGSDDRIVSVIPIAQDDALKPDIIPVSDPDGLSVTLHGSSYPDSSGKPQSLNITLLCSRNEDMDPTFTKYDTVTGVLSIEWKNIAGCLNRSGDDKDGDKNKGGDEGEGEEGGDKESHGSGIGWFFLLLLLAFVAYFALGAYHNYNSYGATGWDLVPHRDFWREVPYLIRDFGEHLCSTLRPGRQTSRRGYMAV